MKRTIGISPKAVLATAAAVLSYLLTQEVTELPNLVELAINAASVALAAYAGSPGDVG